MRMKFVTLLALMAMIVCGRGDARAAEEPVAAISLDGDWAFAYTPGHDDAVPPAGAFCATMPVPGCWDDRFDQAAARKLWPAARFNPDYRPIVFPMTGKPPDTSLPFLMGTGWYRRELEIPVAWKGRQVTLHAGRAIMEAWVYLNGRRIHHHFNHSAGWQAPLSEHLAWGGRNELVIAVDNTRNDRTGSDLRGWQGRSAGLFGHVALRVSGAAQIADLYVRAGEDRLDWQARLLGAPPPAAEFRWRIVDPQSKQAVASGSQPAEFPETRWETTGQEVRLWSDREPKLYEIELELRSEGRVVDRWRQPFGRRRLTAHGTRLRLNGQPVFLRGICDTAFYPATCRAPLDTGWYREHFRRMKQAGFNWLRCHTWVPPEPYLRAADEMGMLIQVEPPAGYTLDQWREILVECRRHPSVVIYCCGNEEMLDEAKIAMIEQCAAELRRAAPDALFNPQEALRGVEYGLEKTDAGLLTQKPFPHHAARLAKLKEFSDVFGQYTWAWLSYTSLKGEPAQIDECLAIYERPCLAHELGICGSYLDLSLEARYRGTRIGPHLYAGAREALRQAGLLERAGVYFRNSAAWQRLMLKDAMETARACRLTAGYDLLGANDNHWHRTGYGCGLFNEFDELKPGRSMEDAIAFNGQSVLLVSGLRERNLVWGARFERELTVSWFETRPLRDATLHWSLRAAGGDTLLEGRVAAPQVEPGNVARIAAIGGQLPALDQPRKLILSVELAGGRGKIANQWDYWAFPAVPPSDAPRDVLVVRALDRPVLEKLLSGARVVFFGSSPFPARGMNYQMGLAGRPEGNLATVIAPHPLTDGFPHDGWCDWQFAPMFSDAAAIQSDSLGADFAPIIEVASSYKNIRKQAALSEWRVGQGRLLVCALNLRKSDPASNFLRSLILRYAASEQFQPPRSLAAERLADLIATGARSPAAAPKTDQALDPNAQLPKPERREPPQKK